MVEMQGESQEQFRFARSVALSLSMFRLLWVPGRERACLLPCNAAELSTSGACCRTQAAGCGAHWCKLAQSQEQKQQSARVRPISTCSASASSKAYSASPEGGRQ